MNWYVCMNAISSIYYFSFEHIPNRSNIIWIFFGCVKVRVHSENFGRTATNIRPMNRRKKTVLIQRQFLLKITFYTPLLFRISDLLRLLYIKIQTQMPNACSKPVKVNRWKRAVLSKRSLLLSFDLIAFLNHSINHWAWHINRKKQIRMGDLNFLWCHL